MDKITKALLVMAGIMIIAGIGYMTGTRMEIKRQAEKEGRKENIEIIAVVNMDDGIMRENAQINYASQLMTFPDSNFVSVGLNDAKAGIQNGSYAAYIIIPENFSALVTSIENNPQKVTLEYAYNPNLNEEAKIQAVRSVHNFNTVLNTNIAYMYIDAVLSAFHDIQDDSAEILSNDILEMKRLQSVDAAKLVASMEHPELVIVEADVQPIELTAYIEQNKSFLMGMSNDYTMVMQKSKDNCLEVQDDKLEVTEAFEDFLATYKENIDGAAEKQAGILEAGQAELEDSIGLYNKSITANENVIKQQMVDMINKQLAADQKQLNEILQNSGDAYQSIQGYVQRTINEKAEALMESYQTNEINRLKKIARMSYLQGAKDALSVAGTPDLATDYQNQLEQISKEDFVTVSDNEIILTVSGNSFVLDSSGDDKYLPEYKEDSITVDWDNLVDESGKQIEIPDIGMAGSQNYAVTLTVCDECDGKAMEKAVQSLVKTLSLEEKGTTISNYIRKELAEPLLQENLGQLKGLEDSQKELSDKINAYENKLFDIEPMEYLEQANLDTYLNDIANNTENMMGAVSGNNREYVDYAADIYRTTSYNMASLQSALNDAYTRTASNVKDSIDSLITSRENINAQNVSLLEGFTKLLTYTRVKSQGNPEVYDYIINPVVVYDHSAMVDVSAKAASRDKDFKKGKFLKGLGKFLLGAAIAACMVIIIAGIYRKYFYQNRGNMMEEREEVF